MIEFISDLLTTKVVFYFVVAYNIGLLVYLGIKIIKNDGGKNGKQNKKSNKFSKRI